MKIKGGDMETQTEVKHIPTPWKLFETNDRENELCIGASWSENVKPGEAEGYGDFRGVYIASLTHQGEDAPVVTKRQALANAKFIVNAVNEREGLLSEIENLREINLRYFRREKSRDALLEAASELISFLKVPMNERAEDDLKKIILKTHSAISQAEEK